MSEEGPVVHLADRVIDLARLTVTHADGTTGTLTAREGALLEYLAARPEQDVERDELLTEVWAYRARFATRAVDVAMRRLRAKIERDPANPMHLISVHGVGYRFVPPAGASTSGPPPERIHNLPEDQATFVGRESELQRVAGLFRAGARLVTIVGPGGVGKTRLAFAYARRHASTASPAGGVWCCDLGDAVGLEGLLGSIAGAVGAPLGAGAEGDSGVRELGLALGARGPALIVLDNFEPLSALASSTLGRWVVDVPRARFLVASRVRLRVPGESVLELGPLDEDDAVALFLERARAAGADIPPDRHGVVREIARLLDGLPLAIELAAPRARVLSPEQLLGRIDERFKLLSAPTRGGPRRQATLHGALDGSWDLLDRWEREALAQCAVFRGGFGSQAAERVIALTGGAAPGAGGVPSPLDVLAALRDKSLLRAGEPPGFPGEPRFEMLANIQAYAAERLREHPDAAACERRHTDHYLAEGRRLSRALRGRAGPDALRRLALETENLVAVAQRCLRSDPPAAVEAVLLVACLVPARGGPSGLEPLVDQAVSLAEGSVPGLVARALTARADLRELRGRHREAIDDLERAWALIGGPTGEDASAVAMRLATLLAARGRLPEADRWCAQALEIARRPSPGPPVGALLGLRGVLAARRDELARAEELLGAAVDVHERLGAVRQEALDRANLGAVLLAQGRSGEAEEHLLRALDLDPSRQAPRETARATLGLAAIRREQGRLDEAEVLARDTLRTARAVGDPGLGGLAGLALATVLLAGGRPELAREQVEREEGLEDDDLVVGNTALVTQALLAVCHAELGDGPRSLAHLARAEALLAGSPRASDHDLVRVTRAIARLHQAKTACGRGAEAEEVEAGGAGATIDEAPGPGRSPSTARLLYAILRARRPGPGPDGPD